MLFRSSGDLVVDYQFSDLTLFNENGLACATIDGNNWGFIDETGNFVIKPQPYIMRSLFYNGFVPVCIDGKYTFLNEQGEFLFEPKFDVVAILSNMDLVAVYSNELKKYGFSDLKGNLVVPYKYDIPRFPFNTSSLLPRFYDDGYAIVYVNGKAGVIDTKGKIVLPLIYDSIR